jgi:hypothetical protein
MDMGVKRFNNKYLLMLWKIFGFHKYEKFMDHNEQSRNVEEKSLLQAEPFLAKIWKKCIVYFKTKFRNILEELVQEKLCNYCCIYLLLFQIFIVAA